MKLRISLVVSLSLFININILANPVEQRYINELYFDSNGWKLELRLNYPDSVSLENWFLVSGADTAYFKEVMYLTEYNAIVLTSDSLSGHLDLNQRGDTLELFQSPGFLVDFLYYGTSGQAAPGLNQSLCRYGGTYDFYIDNSPTIGFDNDSTGATGCVSGYVKDLNGNPAPNIEVIYDDYNMIGKRIYTDSTGHFYVQCAYAKNTQFYVGHSTLPGVFTYVNISPSQLSYVEIKLNWIVTSVSDDPAVADKFILKQNYPNPFNPVTNFEFHVSELGLVTLNIYDLLGNHLVTLLNEDLSPGEYKIEFDGSSLPSGNYYYRLETESFTETKKFTLIK